MSHELSRRQVLKLVSYASAGTAAVGSVPLLSKFLADKASAQTTTTPLVRQNIYSLSPEKIEALREGVRVMKERPSSDPTSWAYQANIHGTTDTPIDDLSRRVWNSCQHGTFFFLSWHRMYLYYFERILRQASGDDTLALPYWDYSGVIPVQFRVPRNDTNPLFAVRLNRVNGINADTEPAPPSISNFARTINNLNFVPIGNLTRSFGGVVSSQPSHVNTGKGEMEKTPHDQIHGYIGGSMRIPETAARDPIFWLHHANIDRLWELWLRRGSTRANPIDNLNWMNYRFTFIDENTQEVNISARQILDTATQLNYVYDNYNDPLASSSPVAPSSSRNINNQRMSASTPQEIRVADGNGEITFILNDTPLTLTSPPQKLLKRRVLVEDSTVTLNLIEVEYEPKEPLSYDIYINLPHGVTPNPDSPYYAGVLSLFSLRQKGTFSLDITDVLSNLLKRDLVARDSISITFVSLPEEQPRNRRWQGRFNKLQQAVRFKRLTITIE